ncbi:hypothetical protein N7489_006061 [Penicillium chrysogenum]|uniref:uncharacterized protein n=1 Tax=Penicillium chrysogenum TaxID=5076 RepID=UPI0024DF2595|nr:uncharacterized protein N7489_006061 [Penicillium chrysogenum]KAJ5235970.1 hypothetical protein N7489_006061 [Penicillium chrysogenum]
MFPGICDNPFQQADKPWKEFECQGSTAICTGQTLLEFFVARGADLLAVDNYGQNALRHLLSCFNRATGYGPPVIDISLKYLLQNCPILVNQVTTYGSKESAPSTITQYETVVYELLAVGADPLVHDTMEIPSSTTSAGLC